MINTQQNIPIQDIQDNLIFLKDGTVSLMIEASAVNFGLLFETEQMAIINAFAGLLNSLSFPIQIVSLSRRLDVSSYLKTLDKALYSQPNPLIAKMTIKYRQYVESLIKENDVLDKRFFVCIYVTSAELSILPQKFSDRTKKALTVITPRRDHIIRQLGRLGLKSKQLKTAEMVKLFYELYNPPENGEPLTEVAQEKSRPQLTRIAPSPTAQPQGFNVVRKNPINITPPPAPYQPKIISPPQPSPGINMSTRIGANPTHPFVVEELRDDLGG